MQTLEQQIRETTRTLKKAYPHDSICMEIESWIHNTGTEKLLIKVWSNNLACHSIEFHTFTELLSHVAPKVHKNEILFRRFR